MKKLIGTYKNGNYQVSIYSDGTKVRENDLDTLIPEFAECCDVKFTNKCSQGCPFCYEGCTKEGEHSDILSQDWIYHMHPWTEVAINGNDLDHPDIVKFLKIMKHQSVITNITVNQNQFLQNYATLDLWYRLGLIYGLGVSLDKFTEELEDTLMKTKCWYSGNIVLHTINGILEKTDLDNMKGKGIKLLVLGYKEVRRGKTYKEYNEERVRENQNYLYQNIGNIIKSSDFEVISFDNLALDQLRIRRLLTDSEWSEFYMGNDGQYTFYIDAVQKTFAKNSVISRAESYPIEGRNIDEMFKYLQEKK